MIENLTLNFTMNASALSQIAPGYYYNDFNRTCYLNYVTIVNSLQRIPKIAFYVLVVAVILAVAYTWLRPLLSKSEELRSGWLQVIFLLMMWGTVLLVPYFYTISERTWEVMNTAGMIFIGLVVLFLSIKAWKWYKKNKDNPVDEVKGDG